MAVSTPPHGPLFLLRVAGLGHADVEPLHSPRSAAWADRVLRFEKRLAGASGEVTDALAEVVGGTEDRELRRALLSVRRDVHNLRAPHRKSVDRVCAAVEGDLARQLESWVGLRDEYQGVLDEGQRLVADELAEARGQLRVLGRDPRVRKGIRLGVPALEHGLDAYLNTESHVRMSARRKGVERSLTNYAFRTAFKTSPFSSFTRLCLGRFVEGGDLLSFDARQTRFRDHAAVNLAVLSSIGQAALSSEEFRQVLPVVLAPGVLVEANRVRYVRRQYSPSSQPTAAVPGHLREADFSVPRSGILDEVLDEVRRTPGVAFDELAARLHAADPSRRPLREVGQYVDGLLERGLLITPALRVDANSPHPTRDFAARLAEVRSRDDGEVRAHIERLSDCAERYGSADVVERGELLKAAQESIRQARGYWGDAEKHRGGQEKQPDNPQAGVSRTVFYEDSVSLSIASASAPRWRAELFPQLQRLSRVLPMFDPMVVERVALGGYFRDRYGEGGRCEDITRFAHDFHRTCGPWMTACLRSGFASPDSDNPPFGQDGLVAVRTAHRLCAASLRDADASSGEVHVGDQLVDEVGACLDGVRPDPFPISFFVQLVGRDQRWLGVLNQVHAGLGAQIGRFSAALEGATGESLGAELREHAVRWQPDSAVFAEITGGYDASNLSWHPPIAPYQIVGPGEVSFRPVDEQLAMGDLVLVDDPDSDQLRIESRSLGARVVPAYFGALAPRGLPTVQRTLFALSCSQVSTVDFRRWLPTSTIGAVTRFPRVRYRDVVLQRGFWKVPPSALPEFGEECAESYLRWRQWCCDHGIPARTLYSLPKREGGQRSEVANKPRYVSVDSLLSLMSFAHEARSTSGYVRMAEMLPAPEDESLVEGYTNEVCVDLFGGNAVTA